MRHSASLLAILAALSVVSSVVAADDIQSKDKTRLKISLGAGVGYGPDYEGSDDYRVVPLWNVRVANLYHPATYAQLSGKRLTSNFLPDDHFRLGVVADYVPDYDGVDDDRVEDLERPDQAVHVGLLASYDFSDQPRTTYAVEIEATYDVLHGNGTLITPRIRAEYPLTDQLSIGGSVAFTWASEDYMSNRYGISPQDAARSGLSTFDADAGIKDVTIGANLTFAITKNWAAILRGAYRQILADAADSPIVDDRGDDSNFLFGALIGYRF